MAHIKELELTSEGVALLDVAFNFHGNRMATYSTDMLVKIWNYCPSEEPNWKNVSTWWDLEGAVITGITWAHPEVGQVLVTSCEDKRIIVWKEQNSDGFPLVFPEENMRWVRVATITLPHFAASDIKFAPIEMGLILGVGSDDRVLIYSANKNDVTHWEMLQSIQCSSLCSKIVWNPSYSKKKMPKNKSYLDLRQPQPKRVKNTFQIGRLARRPKLDDKLPFEPSENDLYVVVPQMKMLGVVSKESDENGIFPISVAQYYESIKTWHLINVKFDVKKPVNDLFFAPRLNRSYDMILVATNEILLYTLYQVMSNTVVRQQLNLIKTFANEGNAVLKTCWDPLVTSVLSSGDQSVRLWRENDKGKLVNAAVVQLVPS